MSDFKIRYPASSTIAITLAGLASSSTKTAGRSSAVFDNTTLLATNARAVLKVTTGTSPTANRTIDVWAVAMSEDSGVWPATFDGTDKAVDFGDVGRRNSAAKRLATIQVTATSDVTFFVDCGDLAAYFGFLPKKVCFWVTHDTAVNLNATAGNHALYVNPAAGQTA